jgi:hypothetical protein
MDYAGAPIRPTAHGKAFPLHATGIIRNMINYITISFSKIAPKHPHHYFKTKNRNINQLTSYTLTI